MKLVVSALLAAVVMYTGSVFAADDVPGRNDPMKTLSGSTVIFSNPEKGARIVAVKEDGTFTMSMADGEVMEGKVEFVDERACFKLARRGVEAQRGTESICVPVSQIEPGGVVTVEEEQVTFIDRAMTDDPGRRSPN